MKRFKKISLVLYLDKTNADAIQYAVSSAKLNSAELYVLVAQKDPLSSDDKERIQMVLDKKIHCEHKLVFLTGHPVVEISRFVGKNDIDLLIIEPDGEDGLQRFFFGSLTLSLLRKAPCAVWVVKPKNLGVYQRILICLDPVAEDKEKQALNDKLIQIGTSLAKREHAECHLVTAWNLPNEGTLKSPFIRTPPETIAELRNEEKVNVARAYEMLQARNKAYVSECQTHLIDGDPVSAISTFAHEKGIDCVVMGTLARSGVQGFLIGNTAEGIINQLECSIMAIKPDGFISPLV